MSSAALLDLDVGPKPSRKERAAKTVNAALRGGVLAGAVAAIAWLLAVALSGTVFFLLIVGTVLALVYTVVRGDNARMGIWGLLAIALHCSKFRNVPESGHNGNGGQVCN